MPFWTPGGFSEGFNLPPAVVGGATSALLMETGDYLLMETADKILLEA